MTLHPGAARDRARHRHACLVVLTLAVLAGLLVPLHPAAATPAVVPETDRPGTAEVQDASDQARAPEGPDQAGSPAVGGDPDPATALRFELPPEAPEAPPVTAAGAIVYDPQIDRILYGKDESGPRLIASTSKMMTALLALEAGTLEDTVTVSARAVEVGSTPGAATLNLSAGQQVPMRSLLAGLIMRSGNDAAVAVAEHVAGDEPAFVARMNARAAELGMDGTRFVDSSGLTEDPGNESTPLDLARLAVVAMEQPDFATWAGTENLTVPGLAPLVNRNELLGSYPWVTGVKTGFTTRAGLCLVASATRDGWTLYTVVLGSEGSFTDAAALLDHAYTAFRRAVPASPATPVGTYRWAGATAEMVVSEPLDTTLSVAQTAAWRTVLDPVAERPAPPGTVVGSAELLVDGDVVDKVEVRLAEGVDAPPVELGPGALAGGGLQESLRAFARLEPVARAA